MTLATSVQNVQFGEPYQSLTLASDSGKTDGRPKIKRYRPGMTPMDGIVDDMANIKPMLDRATKIQRQVNGELQWRVIVYDGALGKQVERLAVGLTEARRLREVLRANVAAAKPGNGPAHAASLAEPGQRHAGASVQALTVNQWAPLPEPTHGSVTRARSCRSS